MQARKFTRHLTNIPFSFVIEGVIGEKEHCLLDIGQGGLCFSALGCIKPGTYLNISIPVSGEHLNTRGKIVWYKPLHNNQCLFGIAFENPVAQSVIEKIVLVP